MAWWFTRKNAPKNGRSKSARANQMALATVQGRYGRRGTHARVANVLGEAAGEGFSYHDEFNVDRKKLAKELAEKMEKKEKSFTQSQREGLMKFAKELKEQVDEDSSKGQRGGGNITMEIPRPIAKILLFAIGLFLLAGGVFFLLVEMALTGEGAASASMVDMSLIYMGITTPPPEQGQYTENPLRAANASRRNN
jgi:hypothetical protein